MAILATQLESKPKAVANKVPPAITSCELRTNATMDIDRDGCLDSILIADGVVTINTDRYAVGTPADKLIVGDWQCDGHPTLALLQVATGTVYVFDEWPAVGKISTPRKVTSVVGATEVDKYRQNTCDKFTVNGSSGIQDVNLKKA